MHRKLMVAFAVCMIKNKVRILLSVLLISGTNFPADAKCKLVLTAVSYLHLRAAMQASHLLSRKLATPSQLSGAVQAAGTVM